MTDGILAKEREFHRLNDELQQKTAHIMLEVESVINSRLDPTVSTVLSKKRYSNSLENLSVQKPVNRKAQDHIVTCTCQNKPESSKPNQNKDEASKKDGDNEVVVQLLKTKVQMLTDELNIIQTEFKKQSAVCRDLDAECKRHEMAKKKLQNQILSMQETISKIETNSSSLQGKIDAQKSEISGYKKEIDELKKEMKSYQNQSSSYDVRLTRSLEEIENLKSALKFSQQEEKEMRDKLRKIQDSSKLELKNMEKQRSELLQAFKKQTLLVDNLKKQTSYLEAAKQIQLTETEFTKLLEWKPEGT